MAPTTIVVVVVVFLFLVGPILWRSFNFDRILKQKFWFPQDWWLQWKRLCDNGDDEEDDVSIIFIIAMRKQFSRFFGRFLEVRQAVCFWHFIHVLLLFTWFKLAKMAIRVAPNSWPAVLSHSYFIHNEKWPQMNCKKRPLSFVWASTLWRQINAEFCAFFTGNTKI